jgi:hypothetical protein
MTWTPSTQQAVKEALERIEYLLWHVIANIGRPQESKKDAIEAHKVSKQALELIRQEEKP